MSEFKSFKFTQSVSLGFASYETGQLKWEETVRYLQGSIHTFRFKKDVYGSFNLFTPEGRSIPGVPHYLLKEVNTSPSPEPSGRVKQVLEAFPAPVPGIRSGFDWECPDSFNSLRVVRDGGVNRSLFDCSNTPVAYLRLVEGDGRRYDKLYYRCSFFGVPRNKVVKV